MGWMILEIQEEQKPEKMTSLNRLERKGERVCMVCLRNLECRFSMSSAFSEESLWMAKWTRDGEKSSKVSRRWEQMEGG